MQRTPSTSRITTGNNDYIINMPESPTTMAMTRSDKFPNNGKKKAWVFRTFTWKKAIHAVPVVVFLCLFILWWFSYPVNLVIRDGQIIGMNSIKTATSLPVNDYRFDHTILASLRDRFLGHRGW